MNTPDADSSLDTWLHWLEALHPSTIDLGLDRVREVYERLALDLGKSRIVIVGGTNGKGSSVAMLSGILLAAGHSVGTYTSPHLLVYNERVRLNGELASDAALTAAFARVETARKGTSLTYFEYGTLAALALFAEAAPDYLVLEVGLGGRLDAVNIVEPDVSLVTNVALDHLDWLGGTREQIGVEKAGIFRARRPAIYGENDMPESVREHARSIEAQLYHKGEQYVWQAAGDTWQWQGLGPDGQAVILEGLPCNDFPIDNAAGVLQALQFLGSKADIKAIRSGLANTRVPGRFQRERYQGVDVLLDVAHNPHAAALLASRLEELPGQPAIHLVLAMLSDKDSTAVTRLLAPHATRLYLAGLGGERGAPVEFIYNHALAAGARTVAKHEDVGGAFQAAVDAVRQSPTPGVVVVTGSFHTVAAVLEML